MTVDDADDESDNISQHSAHTGITNRTLNSAPCLVPGTDDVVTSGNSSYLISIYYIYFFQYLIFICYFSIQSSIKAVEMFGDRQNENFTFGVLE